MPPNTAQCTTPDEHAGLFHKYQISKGELEDARGIKLGHTAVLPAELALLPEELKTLNLSDDQNWLHKEDETPKIPPSLYTLNSAQIEAAASLCFVTLVGEQAPIVYPIVHDDGIIRSVLIEKNSTFTSVGKHFETETFDWTASELINMGAAEVLAACHVLQDTDKHNYNWGTITDNKGNTKLFLIDFDQAFWSMITASLFVDLDTREEGTVSDKPALESATLTLADIQAHPVLTDYKPNNWPAHKPKPKDCYDQCGKNALALAERLTMLSENQHYQAKKYFIYFKFAIIFRDQAFISRLLTSCIHPKSRYFSLLRDALKSNAMTMHQLLLTDEHIKPYLSQIGTWLSDIKQQLKQLDTRAPHLGLSDCFSKIAENGETLHQMLLDEQTKAAAKTFSEANPETCMPSLMVQRLVRRNSMDTAQSKHLRILNKNCKTWLINLPENPKTSCDTYKLLLLYITQLEKHTIDLDESKVATTFILLFTMLQKTQKRPQNISNKLFSQIKSVVTHDTFTAVTSEPTNRLLWPAMKS